MPETDELAQLMRQRTWDKELNLWVGPERTLRTRLEAATPTTIDLLDLFEGDVTAFFEKEHHCSPEDFRSKHSPKKFGQELVRSEILDGGRLKGKYKDRFTFIYDQITKLGKYDGLLFVIDEFRSWQDRHLEGSAAYAQDEEILETLAFVLPTSHLNSRQSG